MISIVDSKAHPHLQEQLHQWLSAEWGNFDFFKGALKTFTVPPPLLAIKDLTLLGGLAFSRYPAPANKNLGLWINGVLVAPEHRGLGIATQLIQAAEITAQKTQAQSLYAKTNIPKLYEKLDWHKLEESEGNVVLGKSLKT